MYGHVEAYSLKAVQQPGSHKRCSFRQKCARAPYIPVILAGWTATLRHSVVLRAIEAAEEQSGAGRGQNTRPPSQDHFVFPWESEMTDIEWAVGTILKTKYPEIHREIIEAACDHGGLLENEPDDDDEDDIRPSLRRRNRKPAGSTNQQNRQPEPNDGNSSQKEPENQ